VAGPLTDAPRRRDGDRRTLRHQIVVMLMDKIAISVVAVVRVDVPRGCTRAAARRSPFPVALSAISPSLSDKFGETDAVFSGNHLGCFLANHDRGRVGVAADHRRHDAGISHP